MTAASDSDEPVRDSAAAIPGRGLQWSKTQSAPVETTAFVTFWLLVYRAWHRSRAPCWPSTLRATLFVILGRSSLGIERGYVSNSGLPPDWLPA